MLILPFSHKLIYLIGVENLINTPFIHEKTTLLPSPKPNIKSHFWSDFGQLITRKTTEYDGKTTKKRGLGKSTLPNPHRKLLNISNIMSTDLLILLLVKKIEHI